MTGFWVNGDAIEDFGLVWLWQLVPKASQLEAAGDLSGFGVDADDFIAHIDIGPKMAACHFEFVEPSDGLSVAGDFDGADGFESLWIDELKPSRSIAHDEVFVIVSEAPAFTLISVARDGSEGFRIVSRCRLFLPADHPEAMLKDSDAFGKQLRGDWALAQDLARVGVGDAQVGDLIMARAFIEAAMSEFQTLRVAAGVVRKGGEDLVA